MNVEIVRNVSKTLTGKSENSKQDDWNRYIIKQDFGQEYRENCYSS